MSASTNLVWSAGSPVAEIMYACRVLRYCSWVCPRCECHKQTVLHRGPVTGGPAGQPMTNEEIAAEYGCGPGTLTSVLGDSSEPDAPTWSWGMVGTTPGGLPLVACACGHRVALSMPACASEPDAPVPRGSGGSDVQGGESP